MKLQAVERPITLSRNWVIFASQESAQPSWGLVAALRLYNLMETTSAEESAIRMWQDVTSGRRDLISDDNEQACRASALYICEVLIRRAERSLEAVGRRTPVQQCIRTLWIEELVVARAVRARICNGEGF